MKSSMVYIDFGEFPGKDRVPREAATRLCCVLMGRNGAADNDVDFPIPENYKFDNPMREQAEIRKLILDCFDKYEKHVDDFMDYRKGVVAEKNRFREDIHHIFME